MNTGVVIGMLVFSVIACIASNLLIKWHCELEDELIHGAFRSVSFIDYLLSGVLGFIGLPTSACCALVCIYLLIIN